MSVKIKKVDLSGFAAEIGLQDGDIILKINDNNIADFLDISFFATEIGRASCRERV